MKNSKLLLGLSSVVVLMLHQGATWAATAGYVQFLNGQVSLTTAKGVTHAMQKGEPVNEGDTVSTARNASAQVRMQDGGFIAVRPDTQLKFDSFKFTGKAGQPESSFFSLFKGGFRAVTGLIGRVNKKDYRINTPAATIGIRGTDHETMYLPANIPGAMAGAYSKVNLGETTLTTNRGTVNVLPNQMGFAGGLNQIPQLQPINTTIFTVAVAPREVKVAKEGKEQGGGKARQAAPKETAGTGQAPAEALGEKAPSTESIRETAVVDNTKLAPSITTTVTTSPAAPESVVETAAVAMPASQTVLPVTASSGALTLNATEQTVTTGGTVVSVQNGIYSAQAKAAADAAAAAAQAAAAAVASATSAKNALLAVPTVNTTSAATAIGTADGNIVSATPAVNAAAALAPIDAATDAASAQTVANNAVIQADAAQAALNANGSFAYVTAGPANTLVQSANTALQSANNTLQANATAVGVENAALGVAQTEANNALTAANTSRDAANSDLSSATARNAAIATAQGGAAALLSTAQAASAAANTAAQAAQAAATRAASLQSAGDLTGAAAELKVTQEQLAIAQSQQAIAQAAQVELAAKLANANIENAAANTAVNSATTLANQAAASATTAQTQADNATTAATNAASAMATVTSQLAVVIDNAAIVAATAPIAAYNNPAVASSNFVGHLSMPASVAANAYHIAHESTNQQKANTQFVLDGFGNLVEMSSTSFQVQPVLSSPTTFIANARVEWSGGTAADTFKLADNSIYAGRWVGATVTVTDLATTGAVAPFSLTPADSLWAVLLTPASGYTQSLVGTTTYTKAGNTTPFDAAGNLGTLNSATLSANFTSQLVNAALNLTMPATSSMAGTYAVTANNMPIDAMGGFGGNAYVPTVTCSSGTCAAGAGGYSANVGGSFAGVAAASAGLGYDIWPTVSVGQPVSNLVQGMVAFDTATPPSVAPAAAYIPNLVAVETAGGQFGFGFSFNSAGMQANPADLTYVTGAAGGASTSGALSSMTFRDIGGGSLYVSTSTVTGGTATSANAQAYAATGIQYGAWTGYTGEQNTQSYQLGSKNSAAQDYWMYGPQGYLDATYLSGSTVVGAMAGTFTYHADGATAPASVSTGLTGTLTSATVTANFVTMQASANLGITMPGNEQWGASVASAPISGGVFNATPTVTYGIGAPATCATCSGTVTGDFTGQNYAGILLTYDLFNNAQTAGSDVAGVVAMTRNWAGNTNPVVTNGTAAPTGVTMVASGLGGSQSINSATLAGNVLTGFGSSGGTAPNTFSFTTTVSCPTCTATASGQVATSGIYYGNWTAGSVTQSFNATFPAATTPLYWITGPEAGPLYLPQALVGTASYAFNSGLVSNSAGVAGTVQGTTALSLDFTKQTVGINLDVSIADTATTPVVHVWNAQTVTGQEAPLGNGQGIGGAAFSASTFNNGSGSGLLTVTVDGSANNVISPSSTINGQLTGTGLTGAIMSFSLNGQLSGATPTFENIDGVAAFTGTAVNTATSHRYVSFSAYDVFAPAPQPVLGFYANNTTRVTQDATGNLTQFDTQFVSQNSGGSSMTFASNTSTLTDHGTDPVSGISWGRWAGGTVNSTDRQTGVLTPATLTGSMHWIAEPVATAATTLPTTGTYTYTPAGGTSPTDNLGNVGTLNSATLSANFTTQTVNLGVNATVAGATLNAAGTNVPIIQKTVFYASSLEPAASTSHLTVTCTGGAACGTTLGGTVVGKFSGAGAIGAAMSYGLQNGTSTVSGVAAFHR